MFNERGTQQQFVWSRDKSKSRKWFYCRVEKLTNDSVTVFILLTGGYCCVAWQRTVTSCHFADLYEWFEATQCCRVIKRVETTFSFHLWNANLGSYFERDVWLRHSISRLTEDGLICKWWICAGFGSRPLLILILFFRSCTPNIFCISVNPGRLCTYYFFSLLKMFWGVF